MTPRTRAPIGHYRRNKGAKNEREHARALRDAGYYPGAKRARDNGSQFTEDQGDLAGVREDALFWSLKNVEAATSSPDGLISSWMTEAHYKAGEDRIPLLVVKRKGHANPLKSWCWLELHQLAGLLDATCSGPMNGLVRMALGDVLDLLAWCGLAETPTPDTIEYPPGDTHECDLPRGA